MSFLLACAAAPLYSSPRWISVTTSHFEMYTTSSEKQAIQSLQGFEQVRYFFLQQSKKSQMPAGRVRIIAFSSEKEFMPYRMNPGVFAYYQQSQGRDYIVMQDINPDHSQAAVHEYTHLMVRHQKLILPLWLEEGMAELYSSLEPKGEKAMVGRPLADHVQALRDGQAMDWNVLFRVDHDSPYYNEKEKMQIFYSQSWALTHMLELGKNYSAGFSQFLAAVIAGTSTPEALQKVYGKSVQQVGKDVQSYVRQATLKAAVFDVKLSKSDLDPQVSELPQFESELALADLLSGRPQTIPEAQRRLLALEKQAPNRPEPQESLGYVAWQQENVQEAIRRFGLAVDRGSRNGGMILQYAGLLQNTGASPAVIIPLLQQVLALQPENWDARVFLVNLAVNARLYAMALATLVPIQHVTPDQAFRFFSLSAIVRVNLKDYSGARNSAQSALKYADSADQRLETAHLLELIDNAGKPGAPNAVVATVMISEFAENRPSIRRTDGLPRLSGTIAAFECLDGGFRLHVVAGAREAIFAMPDLKDIAIRNVDGGALEWSCGALTPRNVTVVYKPSVSGETAGVVTELIF